MNDYYKQFKVEYLENINFIQDGYAKTEMKNDCINYIKMLQQQNENLEILVESLYHGVTLNEEQEELLDSILFGKDKSC